MLFFILITFIRRHFNKNKSLKLSLKWFNVYNMTSEPGRIFELHIPLIKDFLPLFTFLFMFSSSFYPTSLDWYNCHVSLSTNLGLTTDNDQMQPLHVFCDITHNAQTKKMVQISQCCGWQSTQFHVKSGR